VKTSELGAQGPLATRQTTLQLELHIFSRYSLFETIDEGDSSGPRAKACSIEEVDEMNEQMN